MDVRHIDLDQPHIDIDQLQSSFYLLQQTYSYLISKVYCFMAEMCNMAMKQKFTKLLEHQYFHAIFNNFYSTIIFRFLTKLFASNDPN